MKTYFGLLFLFILQNNSLVAQYYEYIDLHNDIVPLDEPINNTNTDDCLDVQNIIENCEIVWLRVNVHFFLDDNCEGEIAMGDKQWCLDNNPPYLPGCDFTAENAHNLAESLINRANEFAENMSDNLPWGNEMIKIGLQPEDAEEQCMPIRFLLDGVYLHCNSNAQHIFSTLPEFYENTSSEINIMITNIKPTGGQNPVGLAQYGGNGFTIGGLSWFAPSTLIHEFAHNCFVKHPWEEEPELSDTWNPRWNWDHDCNPNTANISANSCWEPVSSYQGNPACSPDNFYCTDHPCCEWENQTTNIMAYSGWATNGDYSTMSTQQLTTMLNYINQKFCSKVVIVDPICPPPSANIVIPPLEGIGDDCDFCINFGASMNEEEYNVSFLHLNNGTETLLSNTGWIQKSAGQYCISLRKIKANSDLFPGGFRAGQSYRVVLSVKNDCGVEATKMLVFSLPDKNCQDIPVLTFDAYPNPASGLFNLKITSQEEVQNAFLIVNHPIYNTILNENISVLSQGITEFDLDVSTWPQGLNFIHLVTAEKVHSCTIYKN